MRSATGLRTMAVLACLALLASACGTMLSDEERSAAIRFSSGGVASGGADPAAGDGFGDADVADADAFDLGGLDGADDDTIDVDAAFVDVQPASGSSPVATGPTAPAGSTQPAPAADDPRTPGGSDQPATQGSRPARDSGPRTASDLGVTPDHIVVANVSDVSGPVPGIFESSRQATQAYAAYVNARGGIHGRQLQVMALDGRADASENRAATLQACDRAFAMVGSMGAFDMGGAAAVDECGIPDVTAIPVTAERQQAKNTFGAYPQLPSKLVVTPAIHIKQRYPEEIKKAGLIYTDAPTTRGDALKRKRGYEQLGYEFIYETSVSAVEANMAPFVLEMRRRGVEYVTGVMPYQQIVRLHETMSQQNFRPTVTHWDSVVYDPGFLQLGGAHVEGVEFFINTNMFEEIDQHEEMQTYVQWLRRIAPNAQPTYFGLYSWSASAMFEQVATAVGPDLTREKVLAELRKVNEWTADGLHAPHDPARKTTSGCVIHAQVRGGAFVRSHPASGFDCQPLMDV